MSDSGEDEGKAVGVFAALGIAMLWAGWAACAYLWPIVSVIVIYPVVICTIAMMSLGAERS